MLSPVEQAHILTLPTHIILLDNFMLPNHGYFKWQLILSNFIDFSTFFCAHTCLFWLPPPTQGCHCPHIRLAHPPPTSWPCAITFTQGNSNGNFMCMHMPILGICLPMHTPLHIMPLGPYLPTFLLSFIGTLFIHGWGAIKNPILLGCNALFWPFLSITISKTVHPWLGSH